MDLITAITALFLIICAGVNTPSVEAASDQGGNGLTNGLGALGGDLSNLDSLVNPETFKDLFSGILDLNNSPLGQLVNKQGGPLNDLNGENPMGGLLGSLAKLLPNQGGKLGGNKGGPAGGILGIMTGNGNSITRDLNKVLGDNCTISEQCVAPFSECQDGVCACLDGFVQGTDNQTCTSRDLNCPIGEPLLGSNLNVIGCTRDQLENQEDKPCPTCPTNPALGQLLGLGILSQSNRGGSWADTCPAGSYCSTYDTSHGIAKSRYFGHCCPLPDKSCPVGPSLNVSSCADCPSSTHYCHQLTLGQQGGVLMETCCPIACKSPSAIFKDGRCWQQAGRGDACVVDAQCMDKNTGCRGGICKCVPGAMNLYGECTLVSCPQGNAPRLNLNREIVMCSNSSVCGSGGFCWQELDICCPVPDMKCPSNKIAMQQTMCDVRREAVDKNCGRKETCVDFYRPVEIGKGGLCCRLQQAESMNKAFNQ